MARETHIRDSMMHIEKFDALSINISMSTTLKYPAKTHARSVAKHLGVKEGLIYLRGRQSTSLEDSDQPEPFRQRRYFYYLSGVDFEDCHATYDIGNDDLRLFIPAVNEAEVIWLGPTPSIKECEEKYDVDRVDVATSINSYIIEWLSRTQKPTIYILHENQSPRMIALGHHWLEILKIKKILNWTLLLPAMDAARVIKSDYEVVLIRRANEITSWAHRRVLAKLSGMTNETHIEAVFTGSCLHKGAKKQAYGVIAGSGENASTLHYVANNQSLDGRQLVCLDAGCEWECYASDVTRTFPISGTFSKEAKEIYDIVQEMQEECIKRIKPGVVYRDLHMLAMRIAVKGLMKLGILHNGTFQEVLPTGVAFFPHGLGHHLGLECHDVMYTQRLLSTSTPSHHELQSHQFTNFHHSIPQQPTSSPRPYDGRTILVPNMVLTVEPGLYFSRYALENLYLKTPQHAKYINAPLLEKYYPVGGVRIEDDILVTETGWENLTTAPKGEEACEIIRGKLC